MRTATAVLLAAALLCGALPSFAVGPTRTDLTSPADDIFPQDSRDVTCPPEGLPEGEPICYDNYRDEFNSGCSHNPPIFSVLPCSDPGGATVVCGTYGGFMFGGLAYRDTDWYEIVLDETTTITWCVQTEYPTLTGILDGRDDCLVMGFYDYVLGGPGELCLTNELPAGRWWLWIGTSGFGPDGGACGGEYVGTLTGYDCGPVAVETFASWGRIKAIYR